MPKYLVPIDLNKNELQNAVFQKLASAPSNPIKGLFYFNTTDNTLYVYDGTTWKDALSAGVVDYNNLSNKPIANLTSNTTISSAGIYRIASSGVTATVNTVSVTGEDTIIIYDGTSAFVIEADSIYKIASGGTTTNYVEANAAITGATKAKITYDSKGLVTGGADLSTSDIPDLSSIYISAAEKGANSGVATLGADGKVPNSQLPSYVDDVVEGYYYNGNFYEESSHTTLITPETGKIYIDLDTNKSYRWGGSVYVEISSGLDIATQAEAEAGVNNTKAMTPLRTKQAIDYNIGARTYTTLIGDGTSTTITVTHNLNCKYPTVDLYELVTPNDESDGGSPVVADWSNSTASDNQISVVFATPPASNSIKIIVTKTN